MRPPNALIPMAIAAALCLVAVPLTAGTAASARALVDAQRSVTDAHQPQYHVRPQTGWLNDPNGPFQSADGTYHVFFQHNPHGASWGNIVWGHAASKDLARWTLEAPILTDPPDYQLGGAWSGSVFELEGQPVALYTCTDKRHRQAQCLARPDDASLKTWTRDPKNPVLTAPPRGASTKNWRDPTEALRWNGATYVFVGAGGPTGGVVVAYEVTADGFAETSAPLWRAPRVLGCRRWHETGCASMMIECPDLLPLKTQGRAVKYALKLSLGAEQHRDVFLVGDLVGGGDGAPVFEPDASVPPRCAGSADIPGATLLDCGGAYASKSFGDHKGRRISFSWLADYGGPKTPELLDYNGTLTLPRVVSWKGGSLRYAFARELRELRTGRRISTRAFPAALDGLADAAELRFSLNQTDANVLATLRRRGAALEARLACAADRCGLTISDGDRDTICAMTASIAPGEPLAVAAYVDASVVEWDLAEGRAACAHRWYAPGSRRDALEVDVVGKPRVELAAWQLGSAYV